MKRRKKNEKSRRLFNRYCRSVHPAFKDFLNLKNLYYFINWIIVWNRIEKLSESNRFPKKPYEFFFSFFSYCISWKFYIWSGNRQMIGLCNQAHYTLFLWYRTVHRCFAIKFIDRFTESDMYGRWIDGKIMENAHWFGTLHIHIYLLAAISNWLWLLVLTLSFREQFSCSSVFFLFSSSPFVYFQTFQTCDYCYYLMFDGGTGKKTVFRALQFMS